MGAGNSVFYGVSNGSGDGAAQPQLMLALQMLQVQNQVLEAQVHQLLEAARPEENLSRMFHGWAAWC